MSFLDMVGAKPGETVFFSWAVFESREARDNANEKIMTDPRLEAMMHQNIFDCKRMAFGGFKRTRSRLRKRHCLCTNHVST